MSKSYTIDQLKTFINNFAKCFSSDACLGFKIENTRLKNKFYLCLITKNQRNCIVLSKSYSYDKRISVALDSYLKKINPLIMLRNKITISINDLIEKFNCNELIIYRQIIKAIKDKSETCHNNEFKYCFSTEIDDKNLKKYDFSCHANLFDEFMVQIDLGVK